MHVVRKTVSLLVTGAVACALLASCGGKSSSTASTTPPSAGTISCKPQAQTTTTITGVAVSCTSTGAISADGAAIASYGWSFGDQATSTNTPATTGAPITHYYVQPGNYTVTLTVADDHGTTASKSLIVPISVSTVTTYGVNVSKEGVENWAWISGAKFANSTGDFETQFIANALNQPSARQSAASWKSLDGKLWMLGGAGYDSAGTSGQLNDLWMFDPTLGTQGEWTWVAGSNKANAYGAFGTQGTTASTNVISARSGAATWVDQSGNFWLFGGEGFDINKNYSYLNDMWTLNPQNGEATWKAGSAVGDAPGVGTQGGGASTANSPAGRAFATTWVDSNGIFWLFGGQTINTSTGVAYTLDDLWMFDPSPSSTTNPNGQQWKWVSGMTATNTRGTYPTAAGINSGAATNNPGGRLSAQGWTDKSGNLWLFGGSGFDSAGSGGSLNDLWMYKYDIKSGTGIWTWVAGSKTVGNATGLYTAASGNVPGGRLGTSGWVDAAGNFWMFGGSGSDSTATTTSNDGGGALNELWMFNAAPVTSTNPAAPTYQWTWMGGVNTAGIAGVYVTETPSTTGSPYNTPGSRLWGTSWADSSGNFWLFGGAGMDSQGTSGYLNDLWKVQLN